MTFVRDRPDGDVLATLIVQPDNPAALGGRLQMVLFLHLGQFAKFVIREVERQIDAIDQEAAPLQTVRTAPRSMVLAREPGTL